MRLHNVHTQNRTRSLSLNYQSLCLILLFQSEIIIEQGRKRPLNTPKRMIERREREGGRERER